MTQCEHGYEVVDGRTDCPACAAAASPDAQSTRLLAAPATAPLPVAAPAAAEPSLPPPARPPAAVHRAPGAPPTPPSTAAGPRPPGPAAGLPAYPYRFSLRRLTWIDKVIGAASVALFITLWVPWYSAGEDPYEVSLNGINAHSYVAFALLTSVVLIAYLAARAGWDRLPVRLPIAHAPLLLVLVVLQLAIVVIAVLSSPQGFSHDAGAWIGLVEALLGAVAILGPVLASTQRR